MSGWAALAAAGSAASEFGASYLKQQMADKLDIQKEQRAETRLKAKEDKAAAAAALVPVKTRRLQKDNAWHEIGVNSLGKDIEGTLRPLIRLT